MPWSLDWFAAEALAKAGSAIRRVSWTDKVLMKQGAIWYLVAAGVQTPVKTTDFGADEFGARDWTDQPFSANPCAAVPAYNTALVAYSDGFGIHQLPPPVPGFPST